MSDPRYVIDTLELTDETVEASDLAGIFVRCIGCVITSPKRYCVTNLSMIGL